MMEMKKIREIVRNTSYNVNEGVVFYTCLGFTLIINAIKQKRRVIDLKSIRRRINRSRRNTRLKSPEFKTKVFSYHFRPYVRPYPLQENNISQ
jgi:hypothetical protein